MMRIKDWALHYENRESRRIKKMSWVPLPVKHDSLTYRKLMSQDPEIYLAWVLMLATAAKNPVRGILTVDGQDLSPEDLELTTGCPASIFRKALRPLLACGWLEADQGLVHAWSMHGPEGGPSLVHDVSNEQNRTEGNGREGNAPPNPPEGGSVAAPDSPGEAETDSAKAKKSRKAAALLAEDLPETLDTKAFRRAWSEWEGYRREARKPLTPTGAKRQLNFLAGLGERRARESIEASIRNGWQGLFEPKNGREETIDEACARVDDMVCNGELEVPDGDI